MPKLVIFRGDAVENEIRLSGGTVHVGRHNRNEVVLDDSANGVSRFHAEIRAEGSGYSIVDLNSRNGIWINGKRIKDKAPLALGVPVTLGGFELVLEDDVSTGEFEESRLLNQPTVANPVSSVSQSGGPSRPGSGTRPPSARTPAAASNRQTMLWAGAGIIFLVLCAVTFAVVRYKTRPAPVVADVTPAPVVPVQPETPPPPPVDEKKKARDQHLLDARAQMDAGEYSSALSEHLQPVIEEDPENAEALEMKKQAEEAVARALAAANPVTKTRTVVKVDPPPPTEVETPGIQRKPNESWTEYTARVGRIKVNFQEGKNYADKGDFTNALARFRLVERDQPKYLGVDLSINETFAKQQKELETAMSSGQQNEQAGNLKAARLWYLKAIEIDSGSTAAREKNASLLTRVNTEANKLFDKASFAKKSQDTAGAIRQFLQILDLMLPGDEIREKAAKELEGLRK